MQNISELKSSIDIMPIISQYTSLRKNGKHHSGLCPLHSEKSPSFFVNLNSQSFRCYGCGAYGDVFDFLQKLHGTDLKGALGILGLDTGKPYKPDPDQVRKRELEQQFRDWERSYFSEISREYRFLCKAIDVIPNPWDRAELYKRRTVLEYHLDILTGREDDLKLSEKLDLYREVRRG